MINKSKVGLFLLIGFLFFISVNLIGCLPAPEPVVTIVPTLTTAPIPTATAKTSVTEIFTPAPSMIPVFPGAEGFGVTTVGGRGGRIIEDHYLLRGWHN
jgi:hypothetical protein